MKIFSKKVSKFLAFTLASISLALPTSHAVDNSVREKSKSDKILNVVKSPKFLLPLALVGEAVVLTATEITAYEFGLKRGKETAYKDDDYVDNLFKNKGFNFEEVDGFTNVLMAFIDEKIAKSELNSDLIMQTSRFLDNLLTEISLTYIGKGSEGVNLSKLYITKKFICEFRSAAENSKYELIKELFEKIINMCKALRVEEAVYTISGQKCSVDISRVFKDFNQFQRYVSSGNQDFLNGVIASIESIKEIHLAKYYKDN